MLPLAVVLVPRSCRRIPFTPRLRPPCPNSSPVQGPRRPEDVLRLPQPGVSASGTDGRPRQGPHTAQDFLQKQGEHIAGFLAANKERFRDGRGTGRGRHRGIRPVAATLESPVTNPTTPRPPPPSIC
ncbi:MAG: hypothetical protein U0792_16550 [Gemmataceae bacterium]